MVPRADLSINRFLEFSRLYKQSFVGGGQGLVCSIVSRSYDGWIHVFFVGVLVVICRLDCWNLMTFAVKIH
jgi:hypothetical protein